MFWPNAVLCDAKPIFVLFAVFRLDPVTDRYKSANTSSYLPLYATARGVERRRTRQFSTCYRATACPLFAKTAAFRRMFRQLFVERLSFQHCLSVLPSYNRRLVPSHPSTGSFGGFTLFILFGEVTGEQKSLFLV
ncbi:hypothetical protein [Anaeromusa sp.]|uniref:hypothetical protein n=1 Tax=Anaeromusa sp. TaxID=1872520 RepID=UPI00262E37E5|nr:hypothetical protein [Anaeromusa sp.]MDD3159027.1 hypothetical protein [Anaeromusa sp.]